MGPRPSMGLVRRRPASSDRAEAAVRRPSRAEAGLWFPRGSGSPACDALGGRRHARGRAELCRPPGGRSGPRLAVPRGHRVHAGQEPPVQRLGRPAAGPGAAAVRGGGRPLPPAAVRGVEGRRPPEPQGVPPDSSRVPEQHPGRFGAPHGRTRPSCSLSWRPRRHVCGVGRRAAINQRQPGGQWQRALFRRQARPPARGRGRARRGEGRPRRAGART
mmetsp:Transcript_10706/g.33950  ORF Transcript_10706/g.33950 Transcript_10706/m.33950 type:complete len:217 (+) Transcript_10706:1033-1683(+)